MFFVQFRGSLKGLMTLRGEEDWKWGVKAVQRRERIAEPESRMNLRGGFYSGLNAAGGAEGGVEGVAEQAMRELERYKKQGLTLNVTTYNHAIVESWRGGK